MQSGKTKTRSGPLALTMDRIGTTATLSLAGELDLANVAAFSEAIESCRGAECDAVVLDLGGLEFIDSTGIAALLMANDRLSGDGSALRIIPSRHEAVSRVFELVGVAQSLPFVRERSNPAEA
jgi:anti-anti-sigma factor